MFKSHPGVARSRTNETLQPKSDGPFLQENGYSAATLDIREFEGGVKSDATLECGMASRKNRCLGDLRTARGARAGRAGAC